MIPRPAYLSVDSNLTNYFERLEQLRTQYPRLTMSAIAGVLGQFRLDIHAADTELKRLTLQLDGVESEAGYLRT
jgi:hypothetical protein